MGIDAPSIQAARLAFVPRAEFLRLWYPQKLCVGCRYREDCDWLLLGVRPEAHEGNYWLVRKQPALGPDGEPVQGWEDWRCARAYTVDPPRDVVDLRMHESWRLTEVKKDAEG